MSQKIVLLNSLKHNGKLYEPGAVLTVGDAIDEKAAGRLLRIKAADPVENAEGVDEVLDDSGTEEMAAKLCEIDGVDTTIAYLLIQAGFKTVQSVAEAVPDDLIKIKGIGKKNVKKVQESAEDLQVK